MSQCRHCGRDNEDGVTKCAECGLEMGPSQSRRLLLSAIDQIKEHRSRRILWGIAVLFGLLLVYLLALGPILRIYGVRPSSGWDRLPAIVRMAYEPLDKMPIPKASRDACRAIIVGGCARAARRLIISARLRKSTVG